MPYHLRKRESVSEGVSRILKEQSSAMAAALTKKGGDVDERVHDVRKRLKRLRAILELFPFRLEPKAVEAKKETIRTVSRKLSPVRDAVVVLDCFEAVAIHFTGGNVERIRELLAEAVKHAKRRALSADKLAALATQIRAVCETLAKVGISEDGWGAVAKGLHDSYRKAKRARKEAMASLSPDSLHAFRRRAKRLWEQLRLLSKPLPKSISKLLPTLERLSDALGRHHDFHVLQTTLQDAVAHGLEMAKHPPLEKRLNAEMGKALKRARKLADAAFALKPKGFVSRIHKGWKAWIQSV